jgi:hypothetical protein
VPRPSYPTGARWHSADTPPPPPERGRETEPDFRARRSRPWRSAEAPDSVLRAAAVDTGTTAPAPRDPGPRRADSRADRIPPGGPGAGPASPRPPGPPPQAAHAAPGPGSQGDPPLHRRAHHPRQHWRGLHQRIPWTAVVGRRVQAPANQEPLDPALDAGEHLGDVRVAGRRRRMKDQPLHGVGEHSVQRQRFTMVPRHPRPSGPPRGREYHRTREAGGARRRPACRPRPGRRAAVGRRGSTASADDGSGQAGRPRSRVHSGQRAADGRAWFGFPTAVRNGAGLGALPDVGIALVT